MADASIEQQVLTALVVACDTLPALVELTQRDAANVVPWMDTAAPLSPRVAVHVYDATQVGARSWRVPVGIAGFVDREGDELLCQQLRDVVVQQGLPRLHPVAGLDAIAAPPTYPSVDPAEGQSRADALLTLTVWL